MIHELFSSWISASPPIGMEYLQHCWITPLKMDSITCCYLYFNILSPVKTSPPSPAMYCNTCANVHSLMCLLHQFLDSRQRQWDEEALDIYHNTYSDILHSRTCLLHQLFGFESLQQQWDDAPCPSISWDTFPVSIEADSQFLCQHPSLMHLLAASAF
jgi:hypothetical protein